MSLDKKHENHDNNHYGVNDANAGMGAKISPKERVFSAEAQQTCQSFLAHFKMPKEVGSKIQHESHASQPSYHFLLN